MTDNEQKDQEQRNQNITFETPYNDTTPFSNPYPKETHERVQLFLGHDDVMFIRLIRPQVGTFAAVGGYLWQKLCTALRDRGVKDFTQSDEFEQFTKNAVLVSRDEYDSLRNDSTQWQQYQTQRRSDGRGLDPSQPGGPSHGVNPNPNEKHERKRVKGVRGVHTTKQEE